MWRAPGREGLEGEMDFGALNRKKVNFFLLRERSSELEQQPAEHLVPQGWVGDLGGLLVHHFANPNQQST